MNLVIAGRHRQFSDFVRLMADHAEVSNQHFDPREWKYVTHPNDLRGRGSFYGDTLFFVGEYWLNPCMNNPERDIAPLFPDYRNSLYSVLQAGIESHWGTMSPPVREEPTYIATKIIPPVDS
jgi:hypothetical protein